MVLGLRLRLKKESRCSGAGPWGPAPEPGEVERPSTLGPETVGEQGRFAGLAYSRTVAGAFKPAFTRTGGPRLMRTPVCVGIGSRPVSLIPGRSGIFPGLWASWPRPTGSMPGCWPSLPQSSGPSPGPCRRPSIRSLSISMEQNRLQTQAIGGGIVSGAAPLSPSPPSPAICPKFRQICLTCPVFGQILPREARAITAPPLY